VATGADRRAEAGVSLIEALLMLAVLAIVSALALDFAQGNAARALQGASRSVDRAASVLAEDRFRAIVSNAVGSDAVVRADAGALVMSSVVAAPGPCSAWPAKARLSLELLRDGPEIRLVCRGARGVETLTRWNASDARFSYSADGFAWRENWQAGEAPPFARLDVRDQRSLALWIARPGDLAPEPEP
jgi:hypothetical protein